jgi:transposase
MDHFAGLDVSVKETSVCIVDDSGKIVREVKVASEPEALLAVLKNPAYQFKRIGLEAGPLSQWLYSALAEAGLPMICVETRHMQAVLKAQINKTDRNDARHYARGRSRCRAARAAHGNRRQVPGAPHAGIGDRHPHGGRAYRAPRKIAALASLCESD